MINRKSIFFILNINKLYLFCFFLIIFLTKNNSIFGQVDSVIIKGNLIIGGKCDTILTNVGDWTTLGGGWSIGGQLVANNALPGSYVSTIIDPALEFNETYKITFTVSDYSVGAMTLVYGGNYFDVSSNGSFERYFTYLGDNKVIFSSTGGNMEALNAAISNILLCKIENADSYMDGKLSVGGILEVKSGHIDIPNGKFLSMGFKNHESISYGQTWLTSGVNMAFGHYAGEKNTTGRLTAFGYAAGSKNTDGVLTAFGQGAGQNNTTGHASFFGNYTGVRNTISDSHCFGDEACAYTTSGNQTGMGYYALNKATSDGNSAFGHNSLRSLTTGNGDGFGWGSLYHLSTGDGTAFGESAGHNATTARVTAFGRQSARNVLGGSVLALGWLAGGRNDGTDPVNDTNGMFIGDNTGRSVSSSTILSNYAAIGPNAVISESNTMVFGNFQMEKNIFFGRIGINAYPNSLFRATTNENTNDGFIIDNVSIGSNAALRYTAKVGSNEVSLIQNSINHNIWPSTALLTSVAENANGLVIDQQGERNIRFLTNNATRLQILGNGNLSLGYPENYMPSEKLEVNGSLNTKGFHSFSQSFPVNGTGVSNGSIFKGSDGVFYFKGESGTTSMMGIESVLNESNINSMSTSVNGVTGASVSIINSVSNSIVADQLTTTINGVSSTSVSLPVADGSETKISNGNNTTISGSGTIGSPYSLSVGDATTTEKGILILAGDFSGTALSPLIAPNAVTSSKILDETIATTDIANNAVTIAKLPIGATPTTFLRGDGSWVTPQSYEGSTTISLNGTSFERSALTGDVTADVNSNITVIMDNAISTSKISNNAVTYNKIQNLTATSLLGNPQNIASGPSEISLGSGLSFTGSTLNTVNNGTVTNVSGTLPIIVASGATTPVISVAAANSTDTGVLESSDWNTFNNKIGSVTATTESAVSSSGTSVTINNTAANWNANQLQGNNIANIAPTNGQILSWDTPSNAWKPTSPATILVDANRSTSYTLLPGSNYNVLIYDNPTINEGAVYNNTTGIFTAPSFGLYQIIVSNMFNFISTIQNISTLKLRVIINGSTVNLETAGFGFFGDGNSGSNNVNCNTMVMLNANDTLRVEIGDINGTISPQIGIGQHNLKIIRLR